MTRNIGPSVIFVRDKCLTWEGGGREGSRAQRSTSFSHELGDAFQIFCCGLVASLASGRADGELEGALVPLLVDEVGGSMASRRASAAPLLPPPRQNFHFCFPRPPGASHLSSVTSRRGVRPVSSTSMPSCLSSRAIRGHPRYLSCCWSTHRCSKMPPVEIAAPPPSPAPEIVAAQLNKAPLCLPPTSCPGWIAPCLHSLTVAEALRLERTSRRWRAWLLSADHIWQQLAASSGVSLRCAGPLAPFFRVASWRRVCVELVGALSRDLRGEDAFLGDAAPGCIVEVFETVSPEREYTVPAAGEVFEPAPSFRPSDRGVPVRLRDNQHAWATKYRVLKPRTPRWWRAVCDVDLDDAAARDFCAGLAGRHWVAEPGGVFTFCASRTVMSCVEIKQHRVDGMGGA